MDFVVGQVVDFVVGFLDGGKDEVYYEGLIQLQCIEKSGWMFL